MALTWLVPPLAKAVLRRRLKRGKEDPDRFLEKLGQPSTKRPDGPLIWINAVGLGEVLSLRGLIASLTKQHPKAQVLVTSTTRDSKDLERTAGSNSHQFLPIDATQFSALFGSLEADVAFGQNRTFGPASVELKKRRIHRQLSPRAWTRKPFDRGKGASAQAYCGVCRSSPHK